jgi:hypothetical protein
MENINELKQPPKDVNSPESQELLKNIRNNLQMAYEQFKKFLENHNRNKNENS